MQDYSKYTVAIASFYVAYALFNITDIREQISKITIIFIMIASSTSTYAMQCCYSFVKYT